MGKSQMANLDYTLIVPELQPLAGRFFDKFYELEKGKFRLKFGRDNIIIELPLRLHKTKYIEQAPEASSFAMKIRKELKGKKLSSISQHGKDRVIVFDFEGTQLIAELFGKGNLVLIRDGKILAVYSREKWKGRELKARAEYKFPSTETRTLDEIFAAKGEKPVAAELRALDIGMSYVRAILEDAKVLDSKPLNELTKKETEEIEKSCKKLMDSLSPAVSYEDGKPIAFSLMKEGKEFPNLCEALDEYYGMPEAGAEEQTEKNKELEKLQHLLKTQEEKLVEFAKEEEEAKKKAAFIYENYGQIEELLSIYKKGGLDAIEKIAKEKEWKLNKKEKILEI